MSGYRRFIAYVYEYRKGKKGGNCGFLKVEVKNQRCRIELHLHCVGMLPQVECRVYGFLRKDGLMNGIFLGSCRTETDAVECMLETDASNMAESGIPFGKLGGIVLLTESGGFFGTEWDNQPVRPDNFRELKLPIQPENTMTAENKRTIQESAPAAGTAETSAETAIDTTADSASEAVIKTAADSASEAVIKTTADFISETAMKTTADSASEAVIKTAADFASEAVIKTTADSASEAVMETTADSAAKTIIDTDADATSETAIKTTANSASKTAMKTTANSASKTATKKATNAAIDTTADSASNVTIESIEKNLINNKESISAEPTVAPAEEPLPLPPIETSAETPFPETDAEHTDTVSPIREAASDITAESITETPAPNPPFRFPAEEFSPFDDVEFVKCWKIQPSDLMRCASRVRALRNNRFLQYGYYNFGHLLLAQRPGGRFILGIPGGYDQQERFMANMFGFPYFKECRTIELPRNRGGYWYRLIDTPNFR